MKLNRDEEEIFLALDLLHRAGLEREEPFVPRWVLLAQDNVKQDVFENLLLRPKIDKYFIAKNDMPLDECTGKPVKLDTRPIIVSTDLLEEARDIRERRALAVTTAQAEVAKAEAAHKRRDRVTAATAWARRHWCTAIPIIILKVLAFAGGLFAYALIELIKYVRQVAATMTTMPAPGLFLPM